MSRLNPIEAHTDHCEICLTAQVHLAPIVEQLKREYAGLSNSPIVPCDDCREDVHGKIFMVLDSLWQEINGGQEPCVLCILCAEKRLGRRFRVEDFQSSVLANAPWVYAVERYGHP